MKLNIYSEQINLHQHLIVLIKRKINKIIRIDPKLVNLDLSLKIEKPESLNNKIVEMYIQSSNGGCFAKKKSNTFEESINRVIQAIRKQLLKRKKK